MLFRFVPLNFGMILQSTHNVKWSLNIRSSKSNLKALKTSKRYFYFVVLFNNFFCQCYEVLLSSRLSLKYLFDDDDGEPKTLGETQLQKHIGMSLSTQSQ